MTIKFKNGAMQFAPTLFRSVGIYNPFECYYRMVGLGLGLGLGIGNGTPASGGVSSTTFDMRVKTDNAGTSTDTQFTLPLNGSDTYNFDIDWGDGNTETITTNTPFTHEYGVAGTYIIKIGGANNDFPHLEFNNTDDKDKITLITNWGNIVWQSFERMLRGCSNVSISTSSVPNLSQVTRINFAFSNSSANPDVSNWDVSNIELFNTMYSGNTVATPDTSSWDTSSATGFVGCFSGCPLANPDMSGWNLTNVTTMATCCANSSFSDANYDAFLINAASQTLTINDSVKFDAGDACYSVGAPENSRDTLVTENFWEFSDAGSCLNGNQWEGTVNNLFNIAGNWGNGNIPTSSEVALFNNDFSNPCVINGNISVKGMDIQNGYNSTITQNAGQSIAVGSASIYMSDGTFAGGDSPITVDGFVVLLGGVFTSTSALLDITVGDFIRTGATFNDNGGSMSFTGNAQKIVGVTTFDTLTIDFSNPLSFFSLDNDITVTALLTTLSCTWNTSGNTVFLEGNYIGSHAGDSTPSAGSMEITGTGAQEIANDKAGGICRLPAGFRVNKPSGTLTMYDEVRYFASGSTGLEWVQGDMVFNAGSSIVAGGFSHSVNWPKATAPTMPYLRFDFANSATVMTLLADFEVDKKDDVGTGGGVLKINALEFNCLGDFDHNKGFSVTTNDVLNVGGNFHWINGTSNAITGEWFLNVTGNASAHNVNVQDSNASGGNTVYASNSAEGAGTNNTNWIFANSEMVTPDLNVIKTPDLNQIYV